MNAAGFKYANNNREQLKTLGLDSFLASFKMPDTVLNSLLKDISTDKKRYNQLSTAQKKEIQDRFRSIVARHIWSNQGFYSSGLESDVMLQVLGFYQPTLL